MSSFAILSCSGKLLSTLMPSKVSPNSDLRLLLTGKPPAEANSAWDSSSVSWTWLVCFSDSMPLNSVTFHYSSPTEGAWSLLLSSCKCASRLNSQTVNLHSLSVWWLLEPLLLVTSLSMLTELGISTCGWQTSPKHSKTYSPQNTTLKNKSLPLKSTSTSLALDFQSCFSLH